MKRSLVYTQKKPCLQCKEALFEKPSECRLTSVRFLPSARVGFAPIRFRMLKVNVFNFSNPLPWVLLSSGTLDLLYLAKHTALTSLTSDTFFNFFPNPLPWVLVLAFGVAHLRYGVLAHRRVDSARCV